VISALMILPNSAEQLIAINKVSHGKSAADINPQTDRINVVTPRSRARNNDNDGAYPSK
jgi:hypothetical protein